MHLWQTVQHNAKSTKLASTSLFLCFYTFLIWSCPMAHHSWCHSETHKCPPQGTHTCDKTRPKEAKMKLLILYHKKNHLYLGDSCRKHQINIFIKQICRKSEHKQSKPVCVVGWGKSLPTSSNSGLTKDVASVHQTLSDILKPLWLQHSKCIKKHIQKSPPP